MLGKYWWLHFFLTCSFPSLARFIVENIYNFLWDESSFLCRLWIQMQTPTPPLTNSIRSLQEKNSVWCFSRKRENEPLLAGRLIWGFDIYFFFIRLIQSKETFYNVHTNTHEMYVRWVHVNVINRKLKYYSQHHVLMKGGKFMGAYFYSIILFVFFRSFSLSFT